MKNETPTLENERTTLNPEFLVKNIYAIDFEFNKDVSLTDINREQKKELCEKIEQRDSEISTLHLEMNDLQLLFAKKRNQYRKLTSERCDSIKEMIKLDEKFAKAYEEYKENLKYYVHEY